MNRRDALKTFAAVAAGGSLPSQHAEIVTLLDKPPFDAANIFLVARKLEKHIGVYVDLTPFDPEIWECVRKIEESLP